MKKFKEKMLILSQNKIVIYGIILFGILLKIYLLPKVSESGDYDVFLKPWIDFIKENGYFHALKYNFSNYPVTYQYFLALVAKLNLNPLFSIKIFSILFEYLTAYFIGCLLYERTKKHHLKLLTLAIYPLLPTVLINSSYWAQCDSIYTSFAIGSLYFFFKDKKLLCFLFLGIAFSFKFQTIFILPFYFVLLFRKQVQWYYFLIIPAVYAISILPAYFLERPFMDLVTIYLQKADADEYLTLTFPNIYVWINNGFYYLADSFYNVYIKLNYYFINNEYYTLIKNSGIVFTFLVCFIGALILKNKKYDFSFEAMVKLAFLSTVFVPFILPGMHERYMFMGDAMAFTYLLLFKDKKNIPIGVLLISFISYLLCTRLHYFISMNLLSVYYLFIVVFLFKDFLKSIHVIPLNDINKIIEKNESIKK